MKWLFSNLEGLLGFSEQRDEEVAIVLQGSTLLRNYRITQALLDYFELRYEEKYCETFGLHVNNMLIENMYTIYWFVGRLTRTLPESNTMDALQVHYDLDRFHSIENALDCSNSIPVNNLLAQLESEIVNSTTYYLSNFVSLTIADLCLYFLLSREEIKEEIHNYEDLEAYSQNVEFIFSFNHISIEKPKEI